jgi:DNA-directed RNA polymerase beta' subunit
MSKLVKLSSAQIEDIVNALPPCMAAVIKVADKMREEIQNKLRLQLQDIEIVDNPEAIEKLKAAIRMQHYNSLVAPGEPVGIRSAEANSQPITQSALSAFHSAGSGGSIADGIDAIRELYNVSKERKNEFIYIHFKDKNLIIDDIIHLRRDLEGITVRDLLKLSNAEELIRYDKSMEPWWYNLYTDLKKQKFPFNKDETFDTEDTRNVYLRLNFDINKLYAYNITPYVIAQKLDLYEGIICIPSPANVGIVDIFVNPRKALLDISKKKGINSLSYNIYNAPLLFLQITVSPELKKSYINGIEGVSNIAPIPNEYNVLTIVKTSSFNPETKTWRIVINRVKNIVKGVPISKLINTLKMCGYDILEQNKNYIDVYSEEPLNSDNPKIRNKSPEEVIRYKTTEATKELENKIQEHEKNGTKYVYKDIYPPLLKEFNYVYAYAKGRELMRILANPLVDNDVTICSNPHEVNKALGIEAARNFMIKSYSEVSDSKGYINPHHITLMADFQTSKGVLLPITYKGAARQNTGPLAQASFEHPMEAFISAAAFGKVEEIKSTSTSIFVGKRMILGTGSFKARLDMDAIERAEEASKAYRLRNKEKFDRFERITESTEKNLIKKLDIDEFLFVHSDDMEPKPGIIGVDSVNSISGEGNVEEFKIKTAAPSVPRVQKSSLKLPSFVDNIINDDPLNENKDKIGSFNIKGSRSKSVVKSSISKPGLPALPVLNSSQILSLPPLPVIGSKNDLENDEGF